MHSKGIERETKAWEKRTQDKKRYRRERMSMNGKSMGQVISGGRAMTWPDLYSFAKSIEC